MIDSNWSSIIFSRAVLPDLQASKKVCSPLCLDLSDQIIVLLILPLVFLLSEHDCSYMPNVTQLVIRGVAISFHSIPFHSILHFSKIKNCYFLPFSLLFPSTLNNSKNKEWKEIAISKLLFPSTFLLILKLLFPSIL